MKTRYDGKKLNEIQLENMQLIKETAETLARIIDDSPMDSRLKSRAKGDLEDCVLHAVKGISRSKE